MSRVSGRLSKLRRSQRRRSDERFAERFTTQWAALRAEHRAELRADPPASDIRAGESNYGQARVPYGMDLAAAWSWRLLVLFAAVYVLALGIEMFAVLVVPIAIALLVSALVVPLVDRLTRAGLPRGLAALVVVISAIGVVAVLLTFAGQQISQGANDLSKQVVTGLEQIKEWLKTGPLNASESQIDRYLDSAQNAVTSSNTEIVSRLTEVGTAVTNLVAGLFLVLFSSYFFLADGGRIWAWVVRLFPRAARARVDSSGRIAWTSLTAFIRATVLVAFVDAAGIMIGAFFLGVPFVVAIGVLVFLTSFIPLIGATLSGAVAVLVALVDQGLVVAVLMLGVVVLVQQVEAHVLQPFLLGRLVSVHPLGVILALGAGVLVGGVAGALVAVPFVAAANAVVLHLADTARTEQEADDEPLGDPT